MLHARGDAMEVAAEPINPCDALDDDALQHVLRHLDGVDLAR